VAIYTIAQYRVRSSSVGKVKKAIEEFVSYVRANEPGTHMYVAWQNRTIRLALCPARTDAPRHWPYLVQHGNVR
jgi:quinol monooxygenase YgiN